MDLIKKSLGKPDITFKELEDGKPSGEVEAVFSVFSVRDYDGDVIVPGAIKDQSKVVIAWGHDWNKPIGKGVVTTDKHKATLKGRFFLDTDAGNEAYKTVRNMGDDQDWSWGFIAKDIQDGDPDKYEGQKTREILKAEIFEVSPVLRGANPSTETVAIKNANKTTFASQCADVLEQVKSLVERASSLAELRAKEKRTIGEEARATLSEIGKELSKFAPTLEVLAKGTDTDEYGNTRTVETIIHSFEQSKLRLNDLDRRKLN